MKTANDRGPRPVAVWRLAVCWALHWWIHCPFCQRRGPTAYVHYTRDGQAQLYWRCDNSRQHRWPVAS